MRIEALTHLYILRAKVATGWTTSTADIARSAQVRRDASSAVLLRMLERGLVTRVREGRRYRWEFTAAGAEYLRQRYLGLQATLPAPVPRMRRAARSSLADAPDEDVLARVHAGESQAAIARAYGCSRRTVQKRLERMGIGGRRGTDADASGGLVLGQRDERDAGRGADGEPVAADGDGTQRGSGRVDAVGRDAEGDTTPASRGAAGGDASSGEDVT